MNTILKKITFLLWLFSGSLGWAQNFVIVDKLPEESNVVFSQEEYTKLLNYTPKGFKPNEKTKPDNKVLQGNLASITALELRYAYQQQLKLSEVEIKWMEGEIESLATAFFKEGKPIIIKRTGDYGNCVGRGTEIVEIDGVEVTNIYYCYTFQNGKEFEDRFLAIFNNKTEKLIAAKK